MRCSSVKRSDWHVLTRNHTVLAADPPTRLSTYGISHPAFTRQPQIIIALWPILISRHGEGRRLSYSGWLGETLRWFAGPKTASHRSISRGGRESKSRPSIRNSIPTTTLLLGQSSSVGECLSRNSSLRVASRTTVLSAPIKWSLTTRVYKLVYETQRYSTTIAASLTTPCLLARQSSPRP